MGAPGEAIGTILQMRTYGPIEGEHRRGMWPLSDGGQEGHWLICSGPQDMGGEPSAAGRVGGCGSPGC